MKKILLCAFDPFGGESVNPALMAVGQVSFEGVDLRKTEVPTVFYKSIELVCGIIDEFKPDAVVMIGQAGGRDKITPERVAINVSDARIDDNEGNRPCDEPIREGAPAAYFSTLPVKAIVAALQKEGIPAALSNSAGTFVCNHLMYGVLDHLAQGLGGTIAGFMHVPYVPEQTQNKADKPSMPLDVTVRAIELTLGIITDTIEGK